MRYRMEMIDGKLKVRHVQTDRIIGTVQWYTEASGSEPKWLFYDANEELVECVGAVPRNRLEKALLVAAGHIEYPDPPKGRPCTARIEFELGNVIAEAAVLIAGAVIKHEKGGLKPEMKQRFGELIERLYEIWFVSRFGSYNSERLAHEPYFANRPPSYPRMHFPEAVQRLGMDELTYRFPNAPEAVLKELLVCVIEFLKGALDRVFPPKMLEQPNSP